MSRSTRRSSTSSSSSRAEDPTGSGQRRTHDQGLDRRRWLLGSAAAVAALRVPALSAKTEDGTASRRVRYRLGVASYSLRRFDRATAIAMLRELGTETVNLKSFHLPLEAEPAEIESARRQFTEAGLEIVGGGTVNLKTDDDAPFEQAFSYARAAGMPLLVVSPTPENLPRLERFVREYGVMAAIHNHGPEDPHFPSPSEVLRLVEGMDPRVGLCVDVGHTARTGKDPADEIRRGGNRVLDLHFKDLRDLRERDSQCIVGEGALPTADILAALVEIDYGGQVNLEYEIDAEAPLPGMHRSLAYLRGATAGLERGLAAG